MIIHNSIAADIETISIPGTRIFYSMALIAIMFNQLQVHLYSIKYSIKGICTVCILIKCTRWMFLAVNSYTCLEHNE